MVEQQLYRLIGERIRQLRVAKGMTQQSLADCCDMEKPNLCRIELGRTNPTIRSLFKISIALGVELKHLVDITNELPGSPDEM